MAENARTTPSPVYFWTRFYAQLNTPSSASTFHILGAFSSFISQHFNAAFSTLRCYLFYFTRVQFVRYFNQSIALIIPVLTTFLQLKYQGNDQNKNLFATHPTTMRVAVSSSVVYYLANIALLRFPLRRFAVVAHHCLVWSGYVLVAALASVLFPDSFCTVVYAIFASLSASALLYWLYHKLVAEEDGAEFQVHRRRGRGFLNNIYRILGNSYGQWPQILPV